MTPFIETFTGERFQPLVPDPTTIWVEDIAHSLSNQCRFTGHVREFYSVAEHCIRVSWLLQEWDQPEEIQLWGLMHDASEAYLGDWSTPLKMSAAGEDYRVAEGRLQACICRRFGVHPVQPEIVRQADIVMLVTEARDLMPNKPEHWAVPLLVAHPHEDRIAPWQPKEAKARFLERFHDLDGRR
jgi:uncharacterized protein